MTTMKFRLAAKTDMGVVRTNNEDNFQVAADLTSDKMQWINNEVYSLGEKGTLLVVADGMGGMNAGEVASELAIETVREYFSPEKLTDEVLKNRYSIEKYMNEVIVAADARIKREAKERPETKGMGTTIVIGWILDGKLYVSWCGDSRAYVYNPVAGLHQISKDHSYVQGLVDKGAISKEDAFDYPDSNIITRSLSDGTAKAKPESLLKPYDLCDQDIVLLCTDGLNGMLRDCEIEDVIRNNEVDMDCLADELIKAACEAAGSDNITICLCQILEGGGICTPDTFESFDNRLAGKQRQETRVSSPDTEKTVKWYRKKTFLILMVCLILLVGGGCLFWMRGTDNKEQIETKNQEQESNQEKKDVSTGKDISTDVPNMEKGTDEVDIKSKEKQENGTPKGGKDPVKENGTGKGVKESEPVLMLPSDMEDELEQIGNKKRIESEDILTPVPSEELEPVEDDKKQVKKEDEKENDAKVDKEQKGTTSPANKVQTMEYTVSSGETYSSIARKFNTTVAILMQLNHTKDARLNAGDIIWVPKK